MGLCKGEHVWLKTFEQMSQLFYTGVMSSTTSYSDVILLCHRFSVPQYPLLDKRWNGKNLIRTCFSEKQNKTPYCGIKNPRSAGNKSAFFENVLLNDSISKDICSYWWHWFWCYFIRTWFSGLQVNTEAMSQRKKSSKTHFPLHFLLLSIQSFDLYVSRSFYSFFAM